jgi:hypothetical protein
MDAAAPFQSIKAQPYLRGWEMTDLAHIPTRDGATYDHARDARRLAGQHNRVLAVLQDGEEHTLAEISRRTKDPEASVSARIRDLRKERFGGHTIHRRYVERGLHTYQLVTQKELFL